MYTSDESVKELSGKLLSWDQCFSSGKQIKMSLAKSKYSAEEILEKLKKECKKRNVTLKNIQISDVFYYVNAYGKHKVTDIYTVKKEVQVPVTETYKRTIEYYEDGKLVHTSDGGTFQRQTYETTYETEYETSSHNEYSMLDDKYTVFIKGDFQRISSYIGNGWNTEEIERIKDKKFVKCFKVSSMCRVFHGEYTIDEYLLTPIVSVTGDDFLAYMNLSSGEFGIAKGLICEEEANELKCYAESMVSSVDKFSDSIRVVNMTLYVAAWLLILASITGYSLGIAFGSISGPGSSVIQYILGYVLGLAGALIYTAVINSPIIGVYIYMHIVMKKVCLFPEKPLNEAKTKEDYEKIINGGKSLKNKMLIIDVVMFILIALFAWFFTQIMKMEPFLYSGVSMDSWWRKVFGLD